MRIVRAKEIPGGVYFWRKNFPKKWLKLEGNYTTYLGNPGQTDEFDFGDEEVLVHPMFCTNCFSESLLWPYPKVCDVCGYVIKRVFSKEEIISIISDWTGNPNPHI